MHALRLHLLSSRLGATGSKTGRTSGFRRQPQTRRGRRATRRAARLAAAQQLPRNRCGLIGIRKASTQVDTQTSNLASNRVGQIGTPRDRTLAGLTGTDREQQKVPPRRRRNSWLRQARAQQPGTRGAARQTCIRSISWISACSVLPQSLRPWRQCQWNPSEAEGAAPEAARVAEGGDRGAAAGVRGAVGAEDRAPRAVGDSAGRRAAGPAGATVASSRVARCPEAGKRPQAAPVTSAPFE